MKSKLNIFCYFCLSFSYILTCLIACFCFVLFIFCILELINPILGIQDIEMVFPLSILIGLLFISFSFMIKTIMKSKQFQ